MKTVSLVLLALSTLSIQNAKADSVLTMHCVHSGESAHPPCGVPSRTELTLRYQLSPLPQSPKAQAVNGDFDLNIDSGGCFAGEIESHGTAAGAMTPIEWYGGSFDVDLTEIFPDEHFAARTYRFLFLRDIKRAELVLDSSSGDSVVLQCEGDLP